MTVELSETYRQRFGGVARLYGEAALATLANTHVLIIGIGGVGSWVAEALARSGIGTLSLMDLDDICISNTNRQVHTLQSSIGHSKVATMAERLRGINPDITTHEIEDFLDKDNVFDYIDHRYDVVVDAIDMVMTKTALLNHCKRQKIPAITIGSAGGKLDPQKITYGDLSKTVNDPLFAKVRNNLRRLHQFSRNPKRVFSIEAIYSTEQMSYPDNSGGVCQSKQFLESQANLDCSGGFGAVTMVTASMGFLAASRTIAKILKRNR